MSSTQGLNPKKSFYIWNMIGQGWKIMWQNVWQVLGLQIVFMIIYLAILGLIGLLLPITPQAPWYIATANAIAAWIVSYAFAMGIITLSLQFADRLPVNFSDFFSKLDRILKYLVATIIASICIILGLICFIIPGLIIAVRFSLYGYLIIDKDMDPIEALKESWALVKGVSWRIFGFWLAGVIVYLAGLICFGVGVLFAFPTICIANALIYRTLWKQTHTRIDYMAV
jgi:hypothetical protein